MSVWDVEKLGIVLGTMVTKIDHKQDLLGEIFLYFGCGRFLEHPRDGGGISGVTWWGGSMGMQGYNELKLDHLRGH